MKLIASFLLIFILLLTPIVSQAAGLVPCGGTGESACDLCFLVLGVRDLINWGLGILITVALLAIFISGVMYIVSTGDPGMMESAKNFMKSALIGAVIFLAAWLIVNITIVILGANIGNVTGKGWYWYEFDCDTYQTDPGA